MDTYPPESAAGFAGDRLVETLQDLIIEVDHVAIAVPDLDEAIRWYVEALGFRVIERRVTQGEHTGMLSAVLTAGRAVVVLVQGTTPDSQVTKFLQHFGPGVQHVAFAVTSLDQALARVREGGGAADIPLIAEDGIRQVFLRRDRGSGVRVELIERRGGTFSDRSVTQLFRAFEARDLY